MIANISSLFASLSAKGEFSCEQANLNLLDILNSKF